MNLPPGFEIEEPGMMNLPQGFEIEKEPFFDITRMGDRPTMSLAGTAPDDPTKTLWEAVKHGWRRAGIQAKTGLAGMMQAEVELNLVPSPMFMGNLKMSPTEKKALKEWSTSTIEKADRYYEEHPEEAMQLDEDAGFLATTWDVVSHPEKMLQGIVEAIPLMAEAAIGTAVAGPAGGIAVMAQPIIGNTYQTARKKGTDPFPAFMQATLTGYGEAAIEQWTFGKKIGLAKGIGKIIEKGGKRILWEGTKLYIRGTAEEGSQKFNENLWNWVFTNRSQILTEGVVQAMAVGGPLETVMGGAFAGGGMMLGKGEAGGLVPNSEKIRRVEALRNRVNESSLSDDEKTELYAEFEKTIQDVLAGKFDSGPVEIEAAADPATQLDAAETVAETKAEAIGNTQQLQGVEYEELLELAEQGDELAAYRIQEMTAEAALEEQLPAFEVLFEQMLEGDEVAKTALQEGRYKGAREAIKQLQPTVTGEAEGGIKADRIQEQTGIKLEPGTARRVFDESKTIEQRRQLIKDADFEGLITNPERLKGEKVLDILAQPPTEAGERVEFEDPTSEVILMKTVDVMKRLGEQFTPQQIDAGLQEWIKTPEGSAEASLGVKGIAQDATRAEVFARLLLSKTPKAVAAMDRATLHKVYFKGFVAKLTSIRNNADNIVADVNNKAPLIKKMKSDLAEIQKHYGNIAKDIKNNPELLAELGEIERLLPEYVKAINSFIKSPSEEGSGRIKTTGTQIAEFSDKYSKRLDDQEAKKKVMSFEEWKAHKDPRRFGKTNVETYSTLETQKQRYGWYIEDRGSTRVDSTIPATNEQVRNFATIKVHSLAKLLGLKKKDRQQIQFDLIGQKSLKGMNLEEVKKVEDYFVAQAKERGLSTSTGKELADFIKLNATQSKVQDYSKQKPATLKRMLQTPGRLINQFMSQSKRVERMLDALDGFTEGPIYNSIWTATHTQTVNSRVSRNERVAKFKEALVDIMTPELQTDEGIAIAAETIQAEETATGKKARKLGKRAVRKLVGDSLWARYITSGREVIIEATVVDPELSLNPSERIGIYVAMKNKDSLTHLRFGNLAAFENPDLAALKVVEAMSSQEREIGDWALKDLEENFDRANQAAIIGLGHKLEQQNNYFPMRILGTDVLQQDDFLSELENVPKKTKIKIEPGETKERKPGATQPLDLDFFNVYLNHLTRIEQFIHLAPIAKSVGRILNTKEFRQAVNNVTAGHGAEILNRWLKNSIRGHAIDIAPGLPAQTILWSRKKGVLFFLTGNIPSVLRQFISGFDAVSTHPMTLVYTMQHMTKSADPRYYNMLEKRMRELSPEMNVRSFERYLANIKHQAQAAGILTGKKQWSEKALSWQRWADRRTVVIVWNSFYDAAIHSEAVQKQFELDGSDESAIHFANKMTARTQPMGDVEHLPDFFTAGPIERLLSTFQNQINNRWNFWAHDIYGMRKAGKISRKMVMYRVLFSQILPAMMFGAISRGGLPDDWKDVLFDQTIYAAGPIFLLGRILTDAMLGFSGGRTDVEDALTANVGKTVQAVIKGQPKKAIVPAIKTIGGLTGRIPNSLIRTGQGVYDIMTGETDDLRRLIYSDWSLTNYGWPSPKEKGRKPIQR